MSDGINMADMFGKIAEMQRQMAETQEKLGAQTVTAEAGGGMVKVTANGLQRVTSISTTSDLGCLRTKAASRRAVLRPMPGKRENCSTNVSTDSEENCIRIRVRTG